eukprot:jgi/Chrzof1/3541/UNPLg00750.t1
MLALFITVAGYARHSSHALTTDWRRNRTAVARQRPGSVAQEPLSASAHPAAPVLRRRRRPYCSDHTAPPVLQRRPQAVLRSGQRLQSAILGQHVTIQPFSGLCSMQLGSDKELDFFLVASTQFLITNRQVIKPLLQLFAYRRDAIEGFDCFK